MDFLITPFAILSATTAFIAAIVAVLAWRRRDAPGGTYLTLLMIATVIWTGGMAFEYGAIGIPAKVLWSKIEYIGVLSGPVFFFLFAMEYNQLDSWLTKRNIALLFIIPLISLFLACTNEKHGLIWSGFTPSPEGQNLLVYEHGFWFWIGVVGYSYLLMFLGIGLLIWSAFRMNRAYRAQSISIVIATIAPLMVNILYQAELIPLPGLEPTPFMLVFSGIIYVWNIYHYQLLDLAPIARHKIIETMKDGMLVLDKQNRIVDSNPAAQRLIDRDAIIQIGNNAEDVFASWPEFNISLINNSNEMVETILHEKQNSFLELRISPLRDKRGILTGKLLIIRDITERRRNEKEIQRANERLLTQLAEIEALQANLREQVIRDPLTGLFNRRYLDEYLESEILIAQEKQRTIGILMIDIDHFKLLNDIYGHKAGDLVLKALSKFLLASVRQSDVICRYGGEEFVVILPGAGLEDAQYRAENLCRDFKNTSVSFEENKLKTTISIGVAIYPQHGYTSDEIIHAADSAMYAAKQAGRNCVISYEATVE